MQLKKSILRKIYLRWKPNLLSGTKKMEKQDFKNSLKKKSFETRGWNFQRLWFQSFEKSNQNTYFLQRPAVTPGQWIQKGDLVGDCSASKRGELALGRNLLVAYMPWEGFNFEDAVLINTKILPKYTSLHIEKYEVEINETPYGPEEVTNQIPGTGLDLQKLDCHGIIKIGSWVKEGEILVGKVVPTTFKTLRTHEKLLYDIVGEKRTNIKEKCLRVPQGVSGRVIRICFTNTNLQKRNSQDTKKVVSKISSQKRVMSDLKTEMFKFQKNVFNSIFQYTYFQCPRKQIYGNSLRMVPPSSDFMIFQQTDCMCSLNFQQPIQNFLNNNKKLSPKKYRLRKFKFRKFSLFIETRKNSRLQVSSVKRTSNFVDSLKKITLYIATKREFQVGDKISGRHGNKGILSRILSNSDMPYLANGCTLDVLLNPLGVPSRMNVGQILECLLGFTGQIFQTKFQVLCFDEIYGYEASRSFIYSKFYEACQKTQQKWLFSKKKPGKFHLFDGRNGQLFHQSILVGSTYLMKLIHLVDEKIHARATGPYSLITQQPLRGRAKKGGQRLGEMEVWALQGFGSAYTLQELLTVKSDDLTGRTQVMQALLKNTPLRFGTPESLRVVLRELQCLCLNLQLSD
uniref:DNA-directed RNA polymerase n=1 Tax=Pseudocodium devriesii TaxID=453070 RepID=A0A386B0X4_9CHLO|nr:RNA polymerase b-subunit [Pseudocodium devriesii]AYC65352.1 RNA polymerase b-subunit [Pseudocodium devriesii]